MHERSYTDKKPYDKEKKCRQPQHLKFIPIISDPGVISSPGVLNDYETNLKSEFNGLLFPYILKPRQKAVHYKNFLRDVILISHKCSLN